MGGHHELAGLEDVAQALQDIALPLGMQVEFDLVDQYECHTVGDGVITVRVGDGQAPGEVEHRASRPRSPSES
jgi:hypothetical protein